MKNSMTWKQWIYTLNKVRAECLRLANENFYEGNIFIVAWALLMAQDEGCLTLKEEMDLYVAFKAACGIATKALFLAGFGGRKRAAQLIVDGVV
jgi:hypothetical protein